MRQTQLEITIPHNSTSWELFELKRSLHYISMIKSIPATFSAFVEHSGFCSLFRFFSFFHTNDDNGGFLFTCKGLGVRFNKPFSTHATPFACFFKSKSAYAHQFYIYTGISPLWFSKLTQLWINIS